MGRPRRRWEDTIRIDLEKIGINAGNLLDSAQGMELHSLYRSPNIVRVVKSKRLRWAGHLARMEEGRRAFKILTGTPTGNRPLDRPRR